MQHRPARILVTGNTKQRTVTRCRFIGTIEIKAWQILTRVTSKIEWCTDERGISGLGRSIVGNDLRSRTGWQGRQVVWILRIHGNVQRIVTAKGAPINGNSCLGKVEYRIFGNDTHKVNARIESQYFNERIKFGVTTVSTIPNQTATDFTNLMQLQTWLWCCQPRRPEQYQFGVYRSRWWQKWIRRIRIAIIDIPSPINIKNQPGGLAHSQGEEICGVVQTTIEGNVWNRNRSIRRTEWKNETVTDVVVIIN